MCRYLVLLVFSVVSCGPIIDNSITYPGAVPVDAELIGYLGDFEVEYGRRVAGVSLQLDGGRHLIREGAAGACWPLRNRILISADWFWAAAEWEREVVVFHELGHCQLGRQHRNSIRKKRARSIMHGRALDFLTKDLYRANREVYLDELFGR